MVRHYTLTLEPPIRPELVANTPGLVAMWFRGIVLDHRSIALAVTDKGFGIKIPTNSKNGITYTTNILSRARRAGSIVKPVATVLTRHGPSNPLAR